MKVLVTGGAGYVGSHVLLALIEAGHAVLALDDLSGGFQQAVPEAAGFVQCDMLDTAALTAALERFAPDAAVHMAGRIAVGASVVAPAEYYRVNVAGGLSLLEAMRATGVRRLVFSSSAAVYGAPQTVPIPEEHTKQPTSPYGRTKWMFEQILADYAAAYGFGSVALRYFNAAGAHPSGAIGEAHEPETHLIPLCLKGILTGRPVRVFGADYPTRDGTAVRDYVHVCDLARAHVAACERLAAGAAAAYNCGTGDGYTVREVLAACERVSGRKVPFELAPRRAGDTPELVAEATRIGAELGWRPERSDLEAIIEDAWRFHRMHPRGYREQTGDKGN